MNRAEPKLWESKVWEWSAPAACGTAGASRPLRVDVWRFSGLRIAGFGCWGGVGGSSGSGWQAFIAFLSIPRPIRQPRPPRAGPPACRAPSGVGLRREMLRPHLTVPGAGQARLPRSQPEPPSLEPRTLPPYRNPRQPPSLGSASCLRLGPRTRRSGPAGGLQSWELERKPRAALVRRAPAVLRRAAD